MTAATALPYRPAGEYLWATVNQGGLMADHPNADLYRKGLERFADGDTDA
jgi:hypothetical protein